jgi:hypothetical protein
MNYATLRTDCCSSVAIRLTKPSLSMSMSIDHAVQKYRGSTPSIVCFGARRAVDTEIHRATGAPVSVAMGCRPVERPARSWWPRPVLRQQRIRIA